MFAYETGLLLAALLWVYRSIARLVIINSRFERNLNKVGQRVSWSTLTVTPMTKGDGDQSIAWKTGKYLLITFGTLPLVVLSWLDVIWTVGVLAYRWSKDRGAPAVIREYRWKLKNVDMSFDQLVRETMKVAGDPESKFQQVRAEIIEDMRTRGIRH